MRRTPVLTFASLVAALAARVEGLLNPSPPMPLRALPERCEVLP